VVGSGGQQRECPKGLADALANPLGPRRDSRLRPHNPKCLSSGVSPDVYTARPLNVKAAMLIVNLS
jgi:hypothetical protein